MIGIVCFWDRTATPYLYKYEKHLKENNVDFKVVLWDRNPEKPIKHKENDLVINIRGSKSFLKKVFLFFIWKNRVQKIIKENKFDKIIILSTMPGFLLSRTLTRKFKNRYIFDIRDYTLEKNALFRTIIKKTINNSFFTTISSKGFLVWLPKSSKIVINHNITVNEETYYNLPNYSLSKIEFAFVGNVRLDKQTKSVLQKLNHSRKYNSSFYGRIIPTSDTLQFVSKNNIQNIVFHGEFGNDQKQAIYKNIGLINAVYANSNDPKRYSDSTPLPNRIYDCVIFKRPIVCSKNTYLEKIVNEYSLGFAVNGFDDNVENDFDNYISNFNGERFISGCNNFLEHVRVEEKLFFEKLTRFLKE